MQGRITQTYTHIEGKTRCWFSSVGRERTFLRKVYSLASNQICPADDQKSV